MIIKKFEREPIKEKTLELSKCTYYTLKFLHCQTGYPYSLNSLSERLGFSKREIKAGLVILQGKGLVKNITHNDGVIYYMYNTNNEEPLKFI